jgi:hypothetical protein
MGLSETLCVSLIHASFPSSCPTSGRLARLEANHHEPECDLNLDMDLTFVACEFIPLKGYQDSVQILSGFASGIIAFVQPLSPCSDRCYSLADRRAKG